MPATAVPLGNSMAANKGTVDTRTPKFTQPLANPDIKALAIGWVFHGLARKHWR